MRSGFIWCLATVLLAITPAVAGELSFVGGRTIWQSTQCLEPAVPPLLSGLNPETDADTVNTRITQYNLYIQQAQDYMACISNESQRDAAATSQTITNSGQSVITNTQNNVIRLRQTLQTRQ